MAIFSDGFESGNFNAWTQAISDGAGSVAVNSSNPHDGTYSAVFTSGGANGYAEADKTGLTSSSICYLRAYYKFGSGLPSTDGDRIILQGLMSNSYLYGAFAEIKRISGQLYWAIDHWENGVEQETNEATASNPTTGQWYCLEIKRDVTSDTIQLWVDGVSKVSLSRSISGNSNYAQIGTGWKSYANSAVMYVDAVVVDTAYIGPEGSDLTVTGNLTVDGRIILPAPNGHSTSLQATIAGLMDQTQPSIEIEYGLLVEDIQAYGFLGSSSDPLRGTGGGAILMGHGFTSTTDEPQFTLTDTVGGGSSAMATLTLNNGVITAVNVTNQGSNYTFADITVNSATGSGARLAPVIVNGAIQSINIYSPGSNYSPSDTVTITNNPHNTLYLNQIVNQQGALSPAHLDLGDISIHGHLGVGDTVTSSLNPNPGLGLGNPLNRWQGIVVETAYLNVLSPIPAPYGYGDRIEVNTKLLINGDLQLNGHVVTSLNPSGSLGLGSPTEPWTGIVATTGYLNNLNSISGGTIQVGNAISCNNGFNCQGGEFTLNDAGTPDSTACRVFSNNGTLYLQMGSGNNIIFRNRTANERMALADNGTLTIAGNLYIGGRYLYADGSYLRSSSGFVCDSTLNVASTATISTLTAGGNHAVYATAGGTLTNSASSQRYKQNVEKLNDSSWLYDLRPVTFDWKDEKQAKADGRQLGFIAEEVNALNPQLAWLNTEGQIEGVHYEKFCVPIIAELQKLKAEVDELKVKLAAA